MLGRGGDLDCWKRLGRRGSGGDGGVVELLWSIRGWHKGLSAFERGEEGSNSSP